MSIELNKIMPYLPYKLKIWDSPDEERTEICELLSIDSNGIYELKVIDGSNIFTVNPELWANVKPILRPLSDLFIEIEYNGNKFIPINYNAFKNSKQDIIEFSNNFLHYKAIKYGIIQRLIEWHFDVFGLIKEGLAVDFNSINFDKA